MRKKRLVVLISGGGTNLQAIIDAISEKIITNTQIVAVISNRKAAYGLDRAKAAKIPTQYFPLKPYKNTGKSREEYDSDLSNLVASYQPDLIVLAGWMHIFTPMFLDKFRMQVINLHPALPDEYAGVNAIERAFEAWQNHEITRSGCMIHYVIPEVDAGAVILKQEVAFEHGDTLESYSDRMHQAEHQIIVQAIQNLTSAQ